MKVKPVERMFGKVYDQRRTTPEEHIEAFKNVGRLVSWKEHWPSVDPVSFSDFPCFLKISSLTFFEMYMPILFLMIFMYKLN